MPFKVYGVLNRNRSCYSRWRDRWWSRCKGKYRRRRVREADVEVSIADVEVSTADVERTV